ncbi:hypothetical protein COH21_012863 [Aspergillus flavus]|nr:hypothetical protein COH21_012863 [Aspergillus flavus]
MPTQHICKAYLLAEETTYTQEMLGKLKRAFRRKPPPFTYPTLPQEPYTTRMIRLLPHEDKGAPIQCELFNYDLSETGLGTHLYQALSYVWGSEMKPESIILNGCIFHVTANLHTALLYLRNRQLERILWVDAICINQDEDDQGHEKSKQIPLMRTIYAQAERVIVWLGDATENGDKALEEIGHLENGYKALEEIGHFKENGYKALKKIGRLRKNGHEAYEEIWPYGGQLTYSESSDEGIHIPREAAAIWYDDDTDPIENYNACLRLLQRDWFSRIWVLQEVGVARCVYIMCGSVFINGRIFCEGLTRLRLSSDLWSRISPVAYLIHGALYRPKYQLDSRGSISIGELIGMYQYHNATKQHDKVYALLGLSADPITAALEPNYSLPWKEVFKQTINYIFPECSVEAFIETETAVMKSEGWILGVINSVEENTSRVGKQKIQVLFNYTARALDYQYRWKTKWELQASAALIQEGDIFCLLKGASNPSIIRLCKDHFAVITLAVTPQQSEYNMSPTVRPGEMNSMGGLFDIPLIWKTPLAKTESKDEPGGMDRLMDTPPIPQGEERRAAEKRLKHIMLAVVDIALTILNQAKSKTKIIEQLLRQSGTKDSIAEELAKVCAGGNGMFTNEIRAETLSQNILQHQGNNLPISEETIIAAISGHMSYGCIIMELFLLYQGVSLPVAEKVVKEVAGSGKYGAEIMKILFRHLGDSLPVSEDVLKAAVRNTGPNGPETLEILFQHQGENLPVSEKVVMEVIGSGKYGPEIMKILFRYLGDSLPVSEDVLKAAAENNSRYGYRILEVLIQQSKNLPVSEEVVKAAGRNTGPNGPEIMKILLQHQGNSLPVSKEIFKEATGNNSPNGYKILDILFRHQGKNLPVSEDVLKAAAGNDSPYGHKVLETLIQQDKSLPVSEEVVKAAAGNKGPYGPRILETLIQQDKSLPVSEEVVKAAAGNNGKYGHRILEALIQQSKSLPVSEEVVRTAAGNNGRYGHRILETLILQSKNLSVSEEVVRLAAGNSGNFAPEALEILFQYQGENLQVSEEVVKAAAGNDSPYGPKILEILFRYRGENLPVSEEVVKAAAGNSGNFAPEALEILFQHRGENLPVSEEVIKAAAGNSGKYGHQILKVLFHHRGNYLKQG